MNEATVAFAGRIDHPAVPEFERQLSDAIFFGDERLVLDLSGVTFLGSMAIRAILATRKKLIAAGGNLAIGCNEPLRAFFAAAGLTTVLPIHPSAAAARDALRVRRSS